MTNFPFFQHFVAKLIFTREVEIDEKLTDQIADLLIEKLKLNVVKQDKHQFTNNGLTKFWILYFSFSLSDLDSSLCISTFVLLAFSISFS